MADRVRVFAGSSRHAAVVGYMARLAASPPQVLLLEGASRRERTDAAFYWALSLNCPNASAATGSAAAGPCLSCPECLRILGRSHRDFFFLDGGQEAIKIDDARAVRAVLGEAPRDARKRVVVLAEAQALTEAAANAMLKSLEEPRPDTAFILLAPQRERLLPTLVSRSWVLTLAWPLSLSFDDDATLAAARADWEEVLARFFHDGRGLMDRTGARGTVDAATAQLVLAVCEQALAEALAGKAERPLARYFAKLPPARQRMADGLLAEAQDSLRYTVNPTLVVEWLAAHLFLLAGR